MRPIVAPTVPRGRETVRVCLHAANNEKQIQDLAPAIEAWTGSAEQGSLKIGLREA